MTPRNVMLYWDDANPFALDILAIAEEWRNFCPGWNVVLFGKETAVAFLHENFGEDIAKLFLTCAVPAMRSDFFRVFWAISEGGIYSDVKYVPMREPLFFDAGKDLTVTRNRNGNIRNSIFFSKRNCKELKLIAFEIVKNISKRETRSILKVTGPRLWTKTLSNEETGTMAVTDWRKDMIGRFVEFSNHPSSTRLTDMHWSRQSRRTSIYSARAETLPEDRIWAR